MKQEKLEQDIERAITRVLPLIPKDKAIEKSEFEVVLMDSDLSAREYENEHRCHSTEDKQGYPRYAE